MLYTRPKAASTSATIQYYDMQLILIATPARIMNMPSDCVVIFTDPGFNGKSMELQPGRYKINFPEVGDNTISSIRAPDGLIVIVYDDSDFKLKLRSFNTDVPRLGSLDNKISSLEIILKLNLSNSPSPTKEANLNFVNLRTYDMYGAFTRIPCR